MTPSILLALVCLAADPTPETAPTPSAPIIDIERQALEYVQSWKSGHIRVTEVTKHPALQYYTENKFDCTFSGEKLLSAREDSGQVKFGKTPGRYYIHRLLLDGEKAYYTDGYQGRFGPDLKAINSNRSDMLRRWKIQDLGIIAHEEYAYRASLQEVEYFLANPQRSFVEEGTETVDGELTRWVKFIRTYDNATFKIWFAVDKGPSLVQSEVHMPASNGVFAWFFTRRTLENFNGTWFPKKVVQRYFDHDDELILSADYTVEEATFNHEHDDTTFTLAAMNIRKSTNFWDEKRREYVWNGSEFGPAEATRLSLEQEEQTRRLTERNLEAQEKAILERLERIRKERAQQQGEAPSEAQDTPAEPAPPQGAGSGAAGAAETP